MNMDKVLNKIISKLMTAIMIAGLILLFKNLVLAQNNLNIKNSSNKKMQEFKIKNLYKNKD